MRRGLVRLLILPARFRDSWPALLVCSRTAGASLEGGLKEETHRQIASGGGLETFSSLLAVSPHARSGNSGLSRSRGNRHGRLGRNSLGVGRQHYETEDSTHRDESKEKIWKGCLKPAYLTSVRFFFPIGAHGGLKNFLGLAIRKED